MNKEQLETMANMMGSRGKLRGKDFMMSCPNARQSPIHAGTDNRPSFGIKVEDFAESVCGCFTCKIRGPIKLVFSQLFLSGAVTKEVYDFVLDSERRDASQLLNFLNSRRASLPQETVLSKDFQRIMASCSARRDADPYLLHRGVNSYEIEDYNLGYDVERHCITFPIKGVSGNFVGCVGRTFYDTGSRYFNYEDSAPDCLFGEHLIDPSLSELILVEGPIDAIIAHRVFPNVVALSGLTMPKAHLDKILDLCDYVTLILDGDAAGRNALLDIGRKFRRKRFRTFAVPLPEKEDPASLGAEKLKELYTHNKLVV